MSYTIYIGGQNHTDKGGIQKLILNEQGKCIRQTAVDGIVDPSYLGWHESTRRLFALGTAKDGAEFYMLDCRNGEPRIIARTSAVKGGLCHVGINSKATLIGGASFAAGEICITACAEQDFGERVFYKSYVREGVISHPHCMLPSPDDRFFYLVDLGRDCVDWFDCTQAVPKEVGHLQLAPGDGPRHVLFYPELPIVWLVTEYSNVVYTLSRNVETGELKVLQRLSTLPEGYTATSYGATLAYCPCKKTLYASNRGMDSIAVFDVAADGSLAIRTIVPCYGSWPRHIAVTKDEHFIISCNERSNKLVIMPLDEAGIPGEPVEELAHTGCCYAIDVSL